MTLSIRRVIADGLARVTSRNGGILILAFFLTSVLQGVFVWLLATTYIPLGMAGVPEGAGPGPGTSPPELISAGAALLGGVTGGVLTIPVQIVAVRTLVADTRNHVPEELVFHRLGWATLNILVGSILKIGSVFVLFFISMIVFILGIVAVAQVVPEMAQSVVLGQWYTPVLGVLAMIVLSLPALFVILTLAFIEQEICVRDKNVLQAVIQSWRLMAGNRLRLLLVLIVPYSVNMGFTQLLDQVLPETTFTSPNYLLMQTLLSAESSVISIVLIGIISEAWIQLSSFEGRPTQYWAENEEASTET